MKNPILFFLFLILTVVNIADIITAMFILPGESNPVFLLLGSMWYVFAIKIVVCGGLWFFYKYNYYKTNFVYYQFILLAVLGIALVSVGVYSNVLGILNPVALAEAAESTTAEKIAQYSYFMIFLYLVPTLVSLISFALYDKSRKHANIQRTDGKLF